MAELPPLTSDDEYLFGWDATPGIVSVWADREGRALVWRRVDRRLLCERARFRPWLFATALDDLAQLGHGLAEASAPQAARALVTYRELAGEPGSYRFLLSAPSGRALERMLLAGAQRRLGRSITSLYDLDDYYRVGNVEQYLMQTGRLYFRQLVYADLHRMQIDLETTALDPQRGRIFMAAVRDSHGLEQLLEAPTPADEAALIADLCGLIRTRDPDVIENHNLFGFDLPFLVERAAVLGVPLEFGRAPGPPQLERYNDMPASHYSGRRRVRFSVAGRELIDTMDAVRRHDFVARDLPSHRLKDVARVFGIAGPERVYLPGSQVFATYRNDPERVRRYALDDVAEVDGLSRQLLGAPFALAGMAPRRYERVASAGPAMGILEPMLVRAYLRAGAALPRQLSEHGLPPHTGGALYLFAAGIAEQVVKADIASLYPSLMRTYQIGPAGDRLGALLRIVERLTDLRLYHKDAVRRAAPGSPAAHNHHALQAAMKLIINSAYGYMGAGSMALFADRRAADEVTRRGREVLDHVVAALRACGMVLIEADTDGVYFAAPRGWPEARERAVVAEIGATLPAGIRLEYEGRYRAMLSHEVKNYALLTYDGRLIVRGVALRSSRSEPFGERFLHQALHCALIGDIAGLHAAFHATALAIRTRALPAADLATRVRLSKSHAAYLVSRTTHKEAAYEALLAAGRSSWEPGERVRCYKAQDGGYVWLPDEREEVEKLEDSQLDRLGDDDEDAEDLGDLLEYATPQPVQPAISDDRRDYDVEHYLQVLVTSYAGRLRKAFAPEDFAQLFRPDAQLGLFDLPVDRIQPRWIRCDAQSESFEGQ
ncbi:MAG: ribonuclease H-like domain-containing protein [Kouleothrix sp.]|jgi:DNA polymerase elongation subunit (family B)|nr:ribonuclease H-like domain-containing protein [Kouleothrix sp.]